MSGPPPARATALDAAPELGVPLHLNGRRVTTWSCTPERLDALAVGWLRCEGIVRARDEVRRLEVSSDPPLARVQVDAETLRRLPHDAGGTGGFPLAPEEVPPEPARLSKALAALLSDADELRRLFAEMYDRAPLRGRTGGLHTGGWVSQRRLVDVVEDVGRQNVVDKLVGAALLEDRPAGDALLLLSGRISGAIAAKAWRSGVAALASLSIPTTLARDLAARAGVTLVGRARGEPQVHWV